VIDSTRIATYIEIGVRPEPAILWGFLVFIPLSLIGAIIGRKGIEKIPQEKFWNFVAIFIFLFGIKLFLFIAWEHPLLCGFCVFFVSLVPMD
jgi:uncharacterized membrane protein YfcA